MILVKRDLRIRHRNLLWRTRFEPNAAVASRPSFIAHRAVHHCAPLQLKRYHFLYCTDGPVGGVSLSSNRCP